MEQAIWSIGDNFTGVTPDVDNYGSSNATTALPMKARRLLVPLGIHLTVGLGVSVVGSIANTVVLAVLSLARRQYGSSVNTLIINQAAMDLFSCISVVTIYAVILIRGLAYTGNQIADNICVVFGERTTAVY